MARSQLLMIRLFDSGSATIGNRSNVPASPRIRHRNAVPRDLLYVNAVKSLRKIITPLCIVCKSKNFPYGNTGHFGIDYYQLLFYAVGFFHVDRQPSDLGIFHRPHNFIRVFPVDIYK